MNTSDYYFDLPQNLIAQNPTEHRGEDRLLVLTRENGLYTDLQFSQFPSIIPQNALVVFNNSKVRRARIYGYTYETHSSNEFLVIRPVDNGTTWLVMAKRAKRQKTGKKYQFEDGTSAVIIDSPHEELQPEFKLLEFSQVIDDVWLDQYGHVPLPPYIHREDTDEDAIRYQTVYAKVYGSIASPTAGLHFTDMTMEGLHKRGIETTAITLHVGLGTFLPVRTKTLEEHTMHTEHFFISPKTAQIIESAKKQNRPILAVGTTTVRTLESAWDKQNACLQTGEQKTNIFIYPGYSFQVVDMLLTNFHTPESTLMMLVSAFATRQQIFDAYNHAIKNTYRFFSYGDAMLIV